MFRIASILTLALVACGDDVIPAEDLALTIISGDQVEDTVHIDPAAASSQAITVAAVGDLEVSPIPMVVEFGPAEAATSASVLPTGVSAAVLPAGTVADWVVVDADGQPITDGSCGRPVNVTTIPDGDTRRTVNNWQRPLESGTCWMRVQGMIGDLTHVDTVFERTFNAGPLIIGPDFRWRASRTYLDGGRSITGDKATFGGVFGDANGNPTNHFRVEAEGSWISTVSTEFGTLESRQVRVDTLAAEIGDTATVRFYDDAGILLCDCSATLVEAGWTDIDGARHVSWGVRAEVR